MIHRRKKDGMIRVAISLPKIRVAVFIPACDKPSFTEIDADHKTLQALVGGKMEFADLNEYGISTGLTLYCAEEDDDISPEDRVVTRVLPDASICGVFVILRHQNERFVDLTRDDERLLKQWTIHAKWGSFR